MGQAETNATLEALRKRVWRRTVAANLVAIIPVASWYVLASRHFTITVSITSPIALSLPFIVYLPGYAYSKWHATKRFAQIARWAETDRDPTDRERDLVIDHPRHLATDSFYHWLWGTACAVWSGIANFDLGVQLVGVVAAQLMSTMIACALVYLVVEHTMRPLYARVLTASVPRRASVGVRSRLSLIWVVGSATYFIAIVLVLTGLPKGTADPYILGACGFALVVGILVTVVGARSVANPLDTVSKALARVEHGDLDASVPVDDAGEVGRLQAGFNRMVTGLRERDRLERLFARHVGPDVANRAVAATGLGGAEIEATVMFVDIIGSTALAAERPPEAVVSMINALFERVISIVDAEGGFVNQFQGDGALCVFGAPLEVPDHAARALRAASALRRAIVALGDTYPGFEAAIGVSTGLVVAGDVGTEDRSEYTVIGDAANEASRLTDEAKARASHVLVSEQTVRAAGTDDHEWLAAGSIALRGRPSPTEVYEPAR